MDVLRSCKMPSLDTYRAKRLLLGSLLLASCVPSVWTKDYESLNATSSELNVGDKLISLPNHYFELGIFNYSGTPSDTPYFLSIRYARPIPQAVTWIAQRDIYLSSKAVLQFQNISGNLQLSDAKNPNIWNTDMVNKGAVKVQLLDTGELVLKNGDEKEVWNNFHDSKPTDTLLPGQYMYRSRGHSLISGQRSGNPGIANDKYSFGWDARGVLTLSWTCFYCNLNWKGGPYIPAPDVYAAHTIFNVDEVYFHKNLGHLYITSDPPTAILSGKSDPVNGTTLKRITMFPDGGLRIMQYTIDVPLPLNLNSNLTSNQTWKAVANWVVSDRPDSRSQCSAFGTCGQFSECFSPIDSLEPVNCRCPGMGNDTTKGWFKPIEDEDPAKGCTPQQGQENECTYSNNGNTVTNYSVGMLELPGVDMPWGGDYKIIRNLSGIDCKQSCMKNCHCAGAVYSQDEQTCWMKNGILFNIGYPTVPLHGTDRTSYLRNETVPHLKLQKVKDYKLVKIVVPVVGILGVFLIAMVIFGLWRNERVWQRLRDHGLCFWKKPTDHNFRYPGEFEMPTRGDGT